VAAAAAGTAPGRSLDELAPHNMHIRIDYSSGGPFSLHGCPDNATEQPAEEQQLHSTEGNPSNAAHQVTVSSYMQLLCMLWPLPALQASATAGYPCIIPLALCKTACSAITADCKQDHFPQQAKSIMPTS
jgi:hypothetical protein